MRPDLVRSLMTVLPATCLIILFCGGCFAERSVRMQPGDWVRLDRPDSPLSAHRPFTTRDWIRSANERLFPLLRKQIRPLLTEDLSDGRGRPCDVYAHFQWEREMLHTLDGNLYGLIDTAESVGRGHSQLAPAAPWPDFEDVEIPVAEGVRIVGRVGWASEQGRRRQANAVVILPGLLGDNRILRTRDLAMALRDNGFHVVALEQRGHGQTQLRYPDIHYTYGVLETVDLLQVSEWLERQEGVLDVGLMGFCWGANIALITAWYDGVGGDHPAISPAIRQAMAPAEHRAHFTAGILAISPVVRFEGVMDEVDDPFHKNPALHYISAAAQYRSAYRGYPEVTRSLRRLIEMECAAAGFSPQTTQEGLDFLRLLPYRGLATFDKLNHAHVPVLILHGSNDPFAYAQDVADLLATVHNPAVAACIMVNGGHGGFGIHNRKHYFSLILNFFDREVGAAALRRGEHHDK